VSDVTRILDAIHHGDSKAADELLPLVYGELRKLASATGIGIVVPGNTTGWTESAAKQLGPR
jgi:hypothetical protein